MRPSLKRKFLPLIVLLYSCYLAFNSYQQLSTTSVSTLWAYEAYCKKFEESKVFCEKSLGKKSSSQETMQIELGLALLLALISLGAVVNFPIAQRLLPASLVPLALYQLIIITTLGRNLSEEFSKATAMELLARTLFLTLSLALTLMLFKNKSV